MRLAWRTGMPRACHTSGDSSRTSARRQSTMLTSTCCPSPVRARWSSAPGSPRRRRSRRSCRRAGAGPHRGPLRIARHGHQSCRRLRHRVVGLHARVRARLAVAADRAVDDVGLDRPAGGVVDAEPGRGADAPVLDHHVGLPHQREEQRRPLGVLEVERDRPLPPRPLQIGDAEVLRGPPAERHALRAQVGRAVGGHVAGRRIVDVDHLGAEAGQEQGRLRPGQELGEVEHAEPGEDARHAAPQRRLSGRARSGPPAPRRPPRASRSRPRSAC